jgi:RNA polymerase sigma-70 factor (ECF subfamily)
VKTDEQLVDAARQGSETAFNELVLRYREKLFRSLLTRCPCHADAEDALQDTFVSAYRYLDSFNSRWRFSTWLYRIAIRNAMRQPIHAAHSDFDVADEGDSLAQFIAEDERKNLWLAAKRVLTPDAFSAMWLHYVEDMPMKAVSQALDRSMSWTKVTMFRARRKLTQEMCNDVGEEFGSQNYG